ncbi:MAG: hypothetical protein A2V98_25855 [Planctomycetes bacterium RBG_16_64_12]|nr:MAG: hypothetical protein A2V98_25855 [Planctomycetes bacterium RBG_16_64_12]
MRVKTGSLTFQATTALAPYLRVKLTNGKLVAAGATDNEIGTLEQRVLAADDYAAVVPKNAEGTVKMVANGAIAQYASVYGAAGGYVDDVVNENFIGMAMIATAASGDHIEVLRQTKADELDQLGAIDGNVVIDCDFTNDYPAAATALDVGGTSPWIKLETNGLGVIESAEANGVVKCVADAVAEAATAAFWMPSMPIEMDAHPIVEFLVAVFDIGDAAALDINFGISGEGHATDFDASTNYVAFHLDGSDLSVTCQSKATATVAAVDSLVDLVDDTYAILKIDVTDKADAKFFINGVRVCASTTFDLTGWTAMASPIVHVEKSSNDTTFDVRADRIRAQWARS